MKFYLNSKFSRIVFVLILTLNIFTYTNIESAIAIDPSGNRKCSDGTLAPDGFDPSQTYYVVAFDGPDDDIDLDDGYEVAFESGSGCVGAVIIASGVTVIGAQAFYNALLMTSIQIPSTVIEIGNSSFAGSGLTSINIPGSVTLMGDAAFQQMGFLTTVVIEDGITSLPSQAFYNNFNQSIVNLSLPNSLTTIGEAAFFGAGISTLEIPDSVISIGSQAFRNATNLTDLHIPNSVTTIGDYAFESSSNLSRVEIGSGVTTIGIDAFYTPIYYG